jgi:hypothetical protein
VYEFISLLKGLWLEFRVFVFFRKCKNLFFLKKKKGFIVRVCEGLGFRARVCYGLGFRVRVFFFFFKV